MRFTFLLIFSLLFSFAQAQWEPLAIDEITRYDDVFFIDENNGWVVGGSSGKILKTTDGGASWTHVFTSEAMGDVNPHPRYMRSIEFATSTLGFAGSLYEHLYKTTDGGATWTNVSASIPFDITYNDVQLTTVAGICGLSAPSPTTVFGCGVWGRGPAFVVKSSDAGATWTTIDMTSQASQLVDIFFLDESEGFVSGAANPREDGGVILHTIDGGETWEIVHKTLNTGDFIWKIQTPDSLNFFGSIQAGPANNNVRFIKSIDKGASWSTSIVNSNSWNYIQMIGFKDAMTGWTGGTHGGEYKESANRETILYETVDGGATWEVIPHGSNATFNRFFMVNSETIYMSGRKIYKYNPDFITTGIPSKDISHSMKITPNPSNGKAEVSIGIKQDTRCLLEVIDSQGKIIQELYGGIISGGDHTFNIEIKKAGLYFVTLHTDDGLNYLKLVIK